MDTKLTGIINPGDTQAIKEWIEKQVGSVSDRKTEMADVKTEIALLRQTVDIMHKKIDNIESILKTVSD
jgi:predicted  nucleic acid-binding Zn-ribbon protein